MIPSPEQHYAALDAAMDEAGSGWGAHLRTQEDRRWLMEQAIAAYLSALPTQQTGAQAEIYALMTISELSAHLGLIQSILQHKVLGDPRVAVLVQCDPWTDVSAQCGLPLPLLAPPAGESP